jgi:hypothetical protein
MTSELGASATVASFAPTAFWGMVTVGRVFFACGVPKTRCTPGESAICRQDANFGTPQAR